MGEKMSAKAVAAELGTDAKTFRAFVRRYVERSGGAIGVDTPGRGGTYTFDVDAIDVIRDAFNARRSGRVIDATSLFMGDGDDV